MIYLNNPKQEQDPNNPQLPMSWDRFSFLLTVYYSLYYIWHKGAAIQNQTVNELSIDSPVICHPEKG